MLAAQDDPRPFLWLEAAIAWAEKRLLWCSASDGGSPVEIEPRDLDGDGLSDHVATHPDPTARNNLRQLNIWADGPKVWLTFRGEIVGGAAKFQMIRERIRFVDRLMAIKRIIVEHRGLDADGVPLVTVADVLEIVETWTGSVCDVLGDRGSIVEVAPHWDAFAAGVRMIAAQRAADDYRPAMRARRPSALQADWSSDPELGDRGGGPVGELLAGASQASTSPASIAAAASCNRGGGELLAGRRCR